VDFPGDERIRFTSGKEDPSEGPCTITLAARSACLLAV